MLGLVYSIASYLGFLAAFVYFAFFSAGVGVPKSVDSGLLGGLPASAAIDLSLILLFGLQHSIMARASFKRVLTRVVPQHLERATYVLVSTAALALLMWQWRPLGGEVWQVETNMLAATLWVINALGWLGVPLVSLMIDHLDLFGLRPALNAFRNRSVTKKGFVVPMLYKYVRHPMMCAFFIALWVTPYMTLGHLLLSAGMSCYIVIGVYFEERALARELGQAYVMYQASIPKIAPAGSRPIPEMVAFAGSQQAPAPTPSTPRSSGVA